MNKIELEEAIYEIDKQNELLKAIQELDKQNENEKLAEEHAEWFAKTAKWIYKQAWQHSWKHAMAKK